MKILEKIDRLITAPPLIILTTEMLQLFVHRLMSLIIPQMMYNGGAKSTTYEMSNFILVNNYQYNALPLRWRYNGRDSVSNHQPRDCLLNHLFRRRSKKTSKRRVTGLCAGNSPVTGEFPAQMASNAENVSIWWRHHDWPPMVMLRSGGFHTQRI